MARKVLVIDDDPGVLRMIRLMLSDAGFDIIARSDARDGLDNLGQDAVDLIITDIIMPEMEGIEFISAAKARHPAVPILAISGGGRMHNTDFLTFAKKLGADGILAKPFRREELLAAIDKVLAARRPAG